MSEKLTAAEVNARDWPVHSVLLDSDGDYWVRKNSEDWVFTNWEGTYRLAGEGCEPYEVITGPIRIELPDDQVIPIHKIKRLFRTLSDKEVIVRLKDAAGIPTPENIPSGEPWEVIFLGATHCTGVKDADGLWNVICANGETFVNQEESEITLRYKLVPEVQ
ncbi:hypothetical protein [Corynebacterium callunae]|uniref:hypothetical protein n=1 Tax=Corynebacterium callunae TaxID=1721 RepID=UPI001FFF46CE|nr:hypothetical protein [Corynebacterium callunae]MCK2199170.1 hypothetical protein [Corynebacterium callunae]